jgi:hypothetical protein
MNCSVHDCHSPALKRGWCSAHYQRQRKHGTLEGHSTPRGAATRFYYEVALTYEGDECLIWPYANVRGYAQLVVDGRTQRLVCRCGCTPHRTRETGGLNRASPERRGAARDSSERRH